MWILCHLEWHYISTHLESSSAYWLPLRLRQAVQLILFADKHVNEKEHKLTMVEMCVWTPVTGFSDCWCWRDVWWYQWICASNDQYWAVSVSVEDAFISAQAWHWDTWQYEETGSPIVSCCQSLWYVVLVCCTLIIPPVLLCVWKKKDIFVSCIVLTKVNQLLNRAVWDSICLG